MGSSSTIKKSNCNGIVIVTEKYTDLNGTYFTVIVCDMYDDFAEADMFDDLGSEAEALAQHDALVAKYVDKPNMNAQAAYDEMYGTINGEDAGILAMREAWGE